MRALPIFRRSPLLLPVLLIALAMLAVACGGDEEGEEGTATEEATGTATATEEGELFVDPNAPVVEVSLKEFSVTADISTGEAGGITFSAENEGAVPHNLYIFKTDLPTDQLPVENGRVPEEGGAGVEFVGEIETFQPGLTVATTFDLAPGKYALICNVAGHYQSGMHAEFEVEG